MEVTNNRRLTIRFLSKGEVEETFKSVMCYSYNYSNNKMEIGFSDGYVETYDMKDIDKVEIE